MLRWKFARLPARLAALFVLAGLVGACQQTAGGLTTGVEPVALQSSYRLGTDDRLRIIVFGQDDLSNIYTIDSDGRISMPLIGPVDVHGATTPDVEQRIARRLADGFIRNPNVSVEVQTYRPFYILGQVTSPGQYAYRSGITVKSAVAVAGGFTDRAARRRVRITRTVDGQAFRATVPADSMVMPGDTIEVVERLF